MIIKLTPPQISEYWEVIKHALIKGDLASDDHRLQVLNETLRALLNEKAQCFMRTTKEDRQILAVMITRLKISDQSQDKFLFIQCLFSHAAVKNLEWQTDWNYILQFAKDEGCQYILTNSNNPRIYKLLNTLGVQEAFRSFQYFL